MKIVNLKVVLLSATFIRLSAMLTSFTSHFKCRIGVYPRSSVERFVVPDNKVKWTTEFKEYDPRNFTSPSIYGKPWADRDIGDPNFRPIWNKLDDKVDRESHTGIYQIVNGVPQNPVGRTGICGRGILGRWGPNHAADPVVTRWKVSDNGEIVLNTSNRPILQFVGIKRRDTGEWALPGGMVDPGEKVTTTAVREFQEEATNSLVLSKDELEVWKTKFQSFFSKGEEIYRGYVDDPRNTDNSWMETVAFNFHDEDGSIVGSLNLNAGDDAVGVRWIDATPDVRLYASHEIILKEVLKLRFAKK